MYIIFRKIIYVLIVIINGIFLFLQITHNFCKTFIRILLEKVGPSGELPTTEVLGELFQKNEEADSLSQAYHCYALNYINALNYLETLRTHSEFCEFEKVNSISIRCL